MTNRLCIGRESYRVVCRACVMIAALLYVRLGVRKYDSIAIIGSTCGLRIYVSTAINQLNVCMYVLYV